MDTKNKEKEENKQIRNLRKDYEKNKTTIENLKIDLQNAKALEEHQKAMIHENQNKGIPLLSPTSIPATKPNNTTQTSDTMQPIQEARSS